MLPHLAVVALALAAATAGVVPILGPGPLSHAEVLPHYNIQYKVHSPLTGDVKTHHETKLGHHLKGAVSVKGGDGTMKDIVYSAAHPEGIVALRKRLHLQQAHEGHLIQTPFIQQE